MNIQKFGLKLKTSGAWDFTSMAFEDSMELISNDFYLHGDIFVSCSNALCASSVSTVGLLLIRQNNFDR